MDENARGLMAPPSTLSHFHPYLQISGLQHADLVASGLGEPEGGMGVHDEAQGQAAGSGYGVVDKVVGDNVKAGDDAGGGDCYPDMAGWRDGDAIEAAGVASCGGGVIFCDYAVGRIEAD